MSLGLIEQVAINAAALNLGIAWDPRSDMRYEESTDTGHGIVKNIPGNFSVALLPHNRCVFNEIRRQKEGPMCKY